MFLNIQVKGIFRWKFLWATNNSTSVTPAFFHPFAIDCLPSELDKWLCMPTIKLHELVWERRVAGQHQHHRGPPLNLVDFEFAPSTKKRRHAAHFSLSPPRSLRSWRYCVIKVLAAEPRSKKKEWGRGVLNISRGFAARGSLPRRRF